MLHLESEEAHAQLNPDAVYYEEEEKTESKASSIAGSQAGSKPPSVAGSNISVPEHPRKENVVVRKEKKTWNQFNFQDRGSITGIFYWQKYQ